MMSMTTEIVAKAAEAAKEKTKVLKSKSSRGSPVRVLRIPT
jgi:hypothetical protein